MLKMMNMTPTCTATAIPSTPAVCSTDLHICILRMTKFRIVVMLIADHYHYNELKGHLVGLM